MYFRYNGEVFHYLGYAMKRVLFTMLVAMPALGFANEEFEVTKKNCNLPMKKIKAMLPNQDDYEKVLKDCMEKAAKERWHRRNLTTQK